ncbi:outer membrane lipoprotein carrier protein LolA [Streptomyces sp. NPDC051956]|uniref:outer membrane lipoprotein carrier protein LolA n=1 Tax=Streptomyces sp. NPDC051956 TaxID=3365677 RepID=UPI0037D6B95D
MAPYESESAGRRKATRYVVPVAVVGVAAATIGLVPALADSGNPDLPKLSAQQLIEKIAKSDAQQMSGTVKISTDLGLPSLGGMAGGFTPGAGGSSDGGDGKAGSSADPQSKLMELASGTHTLRVAADGPDRHKLSVLDNAAEYSVIHNGDEVWAYDSASNEAYHSKDAAAAGDRAEKRSKGETPKGVPATPKELADEILKASGKTTSISVEGTAQVAGRDAYKLLVKPKQAGSTVGGITISVDAKTGVPLKFTLTPAGGGKAVVDAGFTKVDFAEPAASTFDFTPPKGTKVTEGDDLKAQDKSHAPKDLPKDLPKGMPKELKDAQGGGMNDMKVIGEGWTSIAELKLPGGQGLPTGGSGSGDVPPEAQKFMDALGDHVTGKFGSGTVFSTRLVNALITDDGKVYAGAVTKDALVKAANAAQ